MANTMVRWTAAGALALAAAGVLDGALALGAASKSFAGRYSGEWPNAIFPWTIQIGSDGAVSGKYRHRSSQWGTSQGGYGLVRLTETTTGAMTGSLAQDGALSVACDVTQVKEYDFKSYPEFNHTDVWSSHFERTATVALDAAGNIAGTSDTGETFVWYDQ